MRLLVVLLLATACRSDAKPKLALRYHPPAGATYHYVLEQNTRVAMPAGQGPLAGGIRQEMRLRIYSTQSVKGPADGGTEVEIVIDSASMIMPGISSDLARQAAAMRGSRSTVVFDDRLRALRNDLSALRAAPPEVTNQMLTVLKGMVYAFPEQPVGRGDSWNVSMDLPVEQFGGIDASKAGQGQTTLTVRDIQTTAADTSVVLDIKSTFPTGPIQLSVMGQRGSMTLAGELTGYQVFSISRGAVVDADIRGNTTITVTVATMQMKEMAVTTETASTIHLASGGSAGR